MPPTLLARQIANAAYWFESDGKPLRADRLHITMFILHDFLTVPNGLVDALRMLGNAVSAAPAPVALDLASGGERSIALRPRRKLTGLEVLHRLLKEAGLATAVTERDGYRFSPHMTLGYRDGRPFSERITPIGWEADEFVLIHSHLGQTRHEVIGRWPLRGAGDPQLSLF